MPSVRIHPDRNLTQQEKTARWRARDPEGYAASRRRRNEKRRVYPDGRPPQKVTYLTVHQQLSRDRGRAAEHLCACGCGEQAEDWAFDEPSGFSTDQSRYRPLKRTCHRRFDS